MSVEESGGFARRGGRGQEIAGRGLAAGVAHPVELLGRLDPFRDDFDTEHASEAQQRGKHGVVVRCRLDKGPVEFHVRDSIPAYCER